MKPTWYPAPTNVDLFTDFILWFSRWEYALKCFPHFSRSNRGFLEPAWSNLEELLASVPVNAPLAGALDYFRATPPMRQITIDSWEPINHLPDWPFLVLSLKTVRNNLFHGGKHHSGPVLDPLRDRELLEHCMTVMREMVAFVPEEMQNIFQTNQ